MAEDHLCATCRAWMCRGDDAWCGFCGAGVAQLRLEVLPPVLEIHQVAPMLGIALTNASCAELEITHVAPLPHWLTLRLPAGAKARAGETLHFWAQARTLDLTSASAADLVLRTRAGDARGELITLSESPRVVVSPEQIVFWSGGGASGSPAAGPTELSLAPEQGRLRILGVRAELAHQLNVSGLPRPQVASREDPVKIMVGVEDERLLPQRWPPNLHVDYEGPHGTESVTVALSIVVKQPPQLSWENADAEPATRFFSERQKIEIVLSNRDPRHQDGGGNNADLVVHSVLLTPPAGLAVKMERQSDLPLRLPGGAREAVRFELDLSAGIGPDDSGEFATRLVHFNLLVESNAGTLSRKMPLRLEPLRVFEGVVAIDFGSSNTCCAVVLPGADPRFLHLDEQRAVAPTVVRYLDLSRTPAEIAIGATVKELAAQSDEVAASTIGSLKQRLSKVRETIDVRPRNSDEWVMRRASEAVADYLREIRRRAEADENAIFRDFILTHPARCPLRHFRRMEEALHQAFGNTQASGHAGVRVEYMQEPIAALVPYFLERAEQALPLDYTVASFDLGGGTTDVAVVRVQQTVTARGEVEIVPEILFCAGVSFGGENLTGFLEERLRDRCVAELAREEPGSELISDAIRAPAKADVLMNSAALRLAAEELKSSLNQEGQVQEPYQITLGVRRKDGLTVPYPFRFADLCLEGGSDLRTEFIREVSRCVGDLTRLLQPARARGIILDTIQLSGKTSYLQEVARTVEREFPEAKVTRPGDPKECVVRGACLERTTRSGRVRLKLPRASHRMTSSIGVWPSRGSAFQPVLIADTPVPADGLEATIPFEGDGWETIALWENTGGDTEDPALLYDRDLLTRLGSWKPVRSEGVSLVALRVGLRGTELSVALIDEHGVVLRCQPTPGGLP